MIINGYGLEGSVASFRIDPGFCLTIEGQVLRLVGVVDGRRDLPGLRSGGRRHAAGPDRRLLT